MRRAQKSAWTLLALCAGAGGLVMALSAHGLEVRAGPVTTLRLLEGFLVAGLGALMALLDLAAARRMEGMVRRLVLALLLAAEGLFLWGLLFCMVFFDTAPRYIPLRSPDGRAVVVREESWLLSGFGEFYLPVCPGLLRDTGVGYTTDDGFRPFSAGLYELEPGEDCVTVRCHTGSGGLWAEYRVPLKQTG